MAELEQRPLKLADAWFSRWRPVLSRFLVPVLAIGLFALAVWTIHHSVAAIRFSQIRREIGAISYQTLLLACGLTACSFLALALQDYVALWSTAKRIPFLRAALGSYIAQSVAHSTGFSILIGGALRARYFMAEGLSFADTMKVQLSFSGTFGMATCILLGLSFVLDPSLAAAQVPSLPEWLIRGLGVALLLGPAGVFIWRSVHVGPLRLFGRQIDMPDTRHLLPQTLLSLTDVACMGAVLYVFLPPELHISYLALLGFFAIAMTIGVTSHVPGGLGVFEATILLLVTPPPAVLPALVTGLVMFRFVYYFLPLVLGGVAIAITESTRHGSRLRALTETVSQYSSPLAPTIFGMLVFLGGAVLLASGALPGASWRLVLVNAYLPHAAIETTHVLAAVIGTLLLLLGRGLSRRLRSAWWVTELLLIAGVAASLIKGLEYEVAALLGLLFLALLPCKPEFYRKARLIEQRPTLGWIIGIVVVVLGMCWLLAFVYRHLDYSQAVLLQFDLARNGPRSLRAVSAMLATLMVVTIWQSLRLTQLQRPARSGADFNRVRSLAGASMRSAAQLALTGDKSFLLNQPQTAFIMYGISGHSWIALGDPVGPRGSWTDLLWDFRDRADLFGAQIAFYDIGPEALSIYLDLGLQVIKYGERARIRLTDFDSEQSVAPALREAHSRLLASGMGVEIHPAENIDRIMGELSALSDDWLVRHQIQETGFTFGFFSRDYIARCPVAVLRLDGRIVAFANLWRGGGHQECAVDLLRSAADVPADLLPGFLLEIMLWAKGQEYRWFDLGTTPLGVETDHRLEPLWARIDGQALQFGLLPDRQVLWDFKQGFSPVWEPSYLACPMGKLPRLVRDVEDLIGGSSRTD